MFEAKGIHATIIGLTCSSQQTYEATEYLFKRLGIEKDDIHCFQYRGNGWPSGIQIEKKDGTTVFVPNNGSIWTSIFHSRLFIRRKCFHCTDTLNKNCDILIADPWLKEYIDEEKIGQTLFAAYTPNGQAIIGDAIAKSYIEGKQVDNNLLETSQRGTILRKASQGRHPKIINRIIKLYSSYWYRSIVLNSKIAFKVHCIFNRKMEHYLQRLNRD